MTDTLLLTRADVARYLDIGDCIEAVESAFRAHASGSAPAPGILGTHVEGGGFHIKTALLALDRPYYVAKVNANFPGNPSRHRRPTIQGVAALFDATHGAPLALLDSMELTSRRTAAASALAARYLAEPDANTLVVCGCGEQGKWHVRAMAHVRPIRNVLAFDADRARAELFAKDITSEMGIAARALDRLDDHDARRSAIWATCTTARQFFLSRRHVRPGAFVAAVGADSEHKQEIDPELLAASDVVADIADQCVAIGDLHHAVAAGVMTREQISAELGDVIAGRAPGRRAADSIVVFDSTGTALQDVASAALVYRNATEAGHSRTIDLAS